MSQRILIIGAGGHGQVIADILLCQQRAGQPILPLAFLDSDPTRHGREILGLPVLGDESQLGQIEHDAIILAIGRNAARQHLFEQFSKEAFATAVHPSAIIAADVEIGVGSMICAGAIINTGARIGRNTIINTAATVDHHNLIGDHVHIAPGVHLGGDVRVGEGALVGIGAAVLPQSQIGAWATVGAGATVIQNIPAHTVAFGTPAKAQSPVSYQVSRDT